MNKDMDLKKTRMKKEFIRDLIILGLIVLVTVVLLLVYPENSKEVIGTSQDFFIEMILILPAVMILMGLITMFVPNNIIVKYMGKTSGMKGIALSFILGALPTGPLYIAFPMAATLIQKGARISNIIIFLSAWACIKIPQELVEIQFLGYEFMITRLVLTIICVILMAVLIEHMIEWDNKKKSIQI
jgi:uncharacterized membrane protein YraQ (UPF0718 family)